MPQGAAAERPATTEEIISALAKQHGIPPMLALAVAQKESSLDLGAVGDSGKALGPFQLHEAAAKDVGIADRSDPLQNIEGGIMYLKQLSDRYQGDVNKILVAYNGGMGNVDAGTVSPAAQAYAADVMATLSGNVRRAVTSPRARGRTAGAAVASGRTSGAGPGPNPALLRDAAMGPESDLRAGTLLKAAVAPFDPRTPEGRQNLAGTAGAAAMTVATRGLPVAGVLPWIARALGPALGAATASAGTAAVEQTAGTAPADPNAVTKAGLTQGAYELGGQVMLWPIRRTMKSLLASRVGQQARTALTDAVEQARGAKRDAMDAVRGAVSSRVEAAKLYAQARGAAARAEGRQTVARAGKAATTAVTTAKREAADHMAVVDLANAANVGEIAAHYDALLATPASLGEAATLTRDVIEGPAKRALDMAGEQVAGAAAKGPAINLAPIRAALDDMAAAARPSFLAESSTPGIGFLSNVQKSSGTGVRVSAGPLSHVEQTKFTQLLRDKLGLTDTHPLPGLLGQIQSAPDTISFADAHKLKMLLDESVNFDRVAKRHVERITKGIRGALREAMSGFEPYDTATAAYREVVPLYRRGVGKDLIAAASTNPDRVARLLNPREPARAVALRRLLVDQSAAGGDAELGHRAWDAVRATFTYDHLIKGGVDGLSDRVQTLVSQHPEFARAVFADESAQRVLSNLDRLGEAYAVAVARRAEALTGAKTASQATVATAESAGRTNVTAARDAAARAIETVRGQNAAALGTLRRQGTEAVSTVRRAMDAGTAAAEAELNRFRRSSVGAYSTRAMESDAAHALVGFGLGPTKVWGALNLVRLLESPRSADLVEWAAYSDANTQRMVRALISGLPDRAMATLLRDAVSVVSRPTDNNNGPAAATSTTTATK